MFNPCAGSVQNLKSGGDHALLYVHVITKPRACADRTKFGVKSRERSSMLDADGQVCAISAGPRVKASGFIAQI
jgi:hypothetical protein